jgi:chaperonin GroEL
VNRVQEGEGNFGYNALTGVYGDMVQLGVLDPCKVTRTALQNAASIAGLILTTDCMIAQIPEKSAAGSPSMGEMGM